MGIYFNPDMVAKVEVPNVEAVQLLQRQLVAALTMERDHYTAQPRLGLALQQSMNVQTPVTYAFGR